jgi:hypothetical protein
VSSTTPGTIDPPQLFEVTHPFHPWHGRRFELFQYRHNWGEYRVWFFDEEQRLRSLPAAWTSVAPPDPFVVLSAGRAPFQLDALSRLVTLLRDLDRDLEGKGE